MNPESAITEHNMEIPLYQRLALEVSGQIKAGELQAGTQLPTIREFAREKQVSIGTANHAYQLLADSGQIEMIQGSGTYVATVAVGEQRSRKEQALEAIDNMIQSLLELDFSLREIQIFLELRMRQQEERFRNVCIAIVGESPELRSVMLNSLANIPNVDFVRFLLSDLREQPFRLAADFDLVVCEEKNKAELEQMVRGKIPVMQLALTLSPVTVTELSSIPSQAQVGILSFSHTFLDRMVEDFSHYASLNTEIEKFLLTDSEDFTNFLMRQELVLVPTHCTEFISRREEERLRAATHEHVKLLRYDLRVDRGSWLYISEASAAIYKEAKQKLKRR
ncbi:MAG TPA: GntR family transcriptional regulator [Clostridiaceae bacterium]|nr:GntR family transcriptional regulator [Clostridiaceae bacterium]